LKPDLRDHVLGDKPERFVRDLDLGNPKAFAGSDINPQERAWLH